MYTFAGLTNKFSGRRSRSVQRLVRPLWAIRYQPPGGMVAGFGPLVIDADFNGSHIGNPGLRYETVVDVVGSRSLLEKVQSRAGFGALLLAVKPVICAHKAKSL